MTMETVQLAPRLPGAKARRLHVATGVLRGEPYVEVLSYGYGYGDNDMRSYHLHIHIDAAPGLIAALRWAVAGPLERQIIDKERER